MSGASSFLDPVAWTHYHPLVGLSGSGADPRSPSSLLFVPKLEVLGVSLQIGALSIVGVVEVGVEVMGLDEPGQHDCAACPRKLAELAQNVLGDLGEAFDELVAVADDTPLHSRRVPPRAGCVRVEGAA